MRKRSIKLLLILSLLSSAAFADTKIGISMATFDDNFTTHIREAMATEGKSLKDVALQFEDARNDVSRQVAQVENFVLQKVDAIIVNPVDTWATKRMTDAARKARIPIVYLNRKPGEPLGRGAYFIGSESIVSGQLQMEYLSREINEKGNVAIIQGALSDEAGIERTNGVKAVAAKYPNIKIAEIQSANWNRTQAIDLTRAWITSGRTFDAIAANNDEMALGALIAMKQTGVSPKQILVGGIDATPDALAAMARGELAVTVFQDAKGQGKGAVDLAARLATGDREVPTDTWIPYQLVTPENYRAFQNR